MTLGTLDNEGQFYRLGTESVLEEDLIFTAALLLYWQFFQEKPIGPSCNPLTLIQSAEQPSVLDAKKRKQPKRKNRQPYKTATHYPKSLTFVQK